MSSMKCTSVGIHSSSRSYYWTNINCLVNNPDANARNISSWIMYGHVVYDAECQQPRCTSTVMYSSRWWLFSTPSWGGWQFKVRKTKLFPPHKTKHKTKGVPITHPLTERIVSRAKTERMVLQLVPLDVKFTKNKWDWELFDKALQID